MKDRKVYGIPAAAIKQRRAIKACMKLVKDEVSAKSEALLTVILERRCGAFDRSALVIKPGEGAGVNHVSYDGERVATLHAPDFRLQSAGLTTHCIGTMSIEEVEDGKPIGGEAVNVKRLVVCA